MRLPTISNTEIRAAPALLSATVLLTACAPGVDRRRYDGPSSFQRHGRFGRFDRRRANGRRQRAGAAPGHRRARGAQPAGPALSRRAVHPAGPSGGSTGGRATGGSSPSGAAGSAGARGTPAGAAGAGGTGTPASGTGGLQRQRGLGLRRARRTSSARTSSLAPSAVCRRVGLFTRVTARGRRRTSAWRTTSSHSGQHGAQEQFGVDGPAPCSTQPQPPGRDREQTLGPGLLQSAVSCGQFASERCHAHHVDSALRLEARRTGSSISSRQPTARTSGCTTTRTTKAAWGPLTVGASTPPGIAPSGTSTSARRATDSSRTVPRSRRSAS